MQTTSNIAKKIDTLLAADFSESINVEGIVVNIDAKNNVFAIRDENKTVFLCRAKTDVSHLAINDNLILICFVKFGNGYGIHLLVEYFYTVTEAEKMQSKKKAYEMYKKNILSDKDKYKTKLAKINNMRYPKYVKNIGLIVLDSHKQMMNKFMTEFKSKCRGNLFVYNMKKSNLSKDLSLAMEYMKKYHNIDVVCVVMDHMNLSEVLEMSSFENIRYVFGRKDYPYLISVSDANKNDRIIDILANKHFKTTNECIDHIRINQNTSIEKIMHSFETEKENATGIIQGYYDKIADFEQKYNQQLFSLGINLQTSTNKLAFNKLKSLLLEKINEKVSELTDIKKMITMNLLRDPQMDEYFDNVLRGGADTMPSSENKNLLDIFSYPATENVTSITPADELFFNSFSPSKHCGLLDTAEDSPDSILELCPAKETVPAHTGNVPQKIDIFNSIINEETNKILNISQPIVRTQTDQNKVTAYKPELRMSEGTNLRPLHSELRIIDKSHMPLQNEQVVIRKTFSEGEF
uniref:Uncharacterized protein n=1 Tax=viral metagenome TaxID=1070528 RepID=A0A6C0CBJ9_9ZZZZ